MAISRDDEVSRAHDEEYSRLLETWKLPFTRDCVTRFLCARLIEHRQELIDESFHETFYSAFDSPLEYAFLVCWNMHRASLSAELRFRRTFYLAPQVQSGAYRVDFQVKPYGGGGGPSCHGGTGTWCHACPPDSVDCVGFPKIAIELDGHEFHEKTKEQVTARNARDRALLADGWTVLRFSGSEFYGNPLACIRQVWEHALTAAERCDREARRLREEL
jgi:hypothetical protein